MSYKNCNIIFNPLPTGTEYAIWFGNTLINEGRSSSQEGATAAAKDFIDHFINDAPPALSYKY